MCGDHIAFLGHLGDTGDLHGFETYRYFGRHHCYWQGSLCPSLPLSLGLGTLRIGSQPQLQSCPLGRLPLSHRLIHPLSVHTFFSSLAFLPALQHLTPFLFPLRVLLSPLVSRSPHLALNRMPLAFLATMLLGLWESSPPMSRLSSCPSRNTASQRALQPRLAPKLDSG